jgi:hypothetical protein
MSCSRLLAGDLLALHREPHEIRAAQAADEETPSIVEVPIFDLLIRFRLLSGDL